MPRREPRRRRSSGAGRSDVPGRMAVPRHRRTGPRDCRDDAAGESRLTEPRCHPRRHGLHPAAQRRRDRAAGAGRERHLGAERNSGGQAGHERPSGARPGRGRALRPRRSARDPDHRRRPLRQFDGPGGAGSLQGDAQAPRCPHAGDRGDAAESVAERLADVARHLPRLGLQRARPDQSRQREEPDGGVDVGHELDWHDRVHAARARRHHVPVELRRDDSGARRQKRQPALAVPPDDPGRLQPRHLLPDQAIAGHRRQQADRADHRHAPHRARRQDRRGGVGCRDRRLQEEQAGLQRRSARRQRQGHHGRQRLRAGRRRLLHHRPRSGDRQGAVAVQHRRAARRARRRHLEQPADGEAVGRLGVDAAELRPGAEPGLYRGTGSPFPWSSVDRGTYNPKAAARTATACTPTRRWRSIPTPASWSGTTSICRTTPSTRTMPSSASSRRSSGRAGSARP